MDQDGIVKWRYRNTVLAVSVYGFFAVQATRFALSPVVPNILDTFSTSKAMVGLALTGMWAAYALLQYPGGVLGDRFGERRILLFALGLTGAGSLAVAAAPTFGFFAVFVLVLGAGAGLFFPVAAALTTDLFERKGQVLGLIASGASVAGMIAPAVAAIVATRYGWRTALPLVGLAVLPAIVLLWRRVRPRASATPAQSLRGGLDPTMVVELLGRPTVLFSLFLSVILSFTFQSVFSFLPTFLVEYQSFSVQNAGIAFGGSYLLSAIGQAGMGRVSDISSRDTAITISTVCIITGMGTLLTMSDRLVVLGGVAFVGFGLSVGGVMNARFVDNFGEDDRGTSLGLVRLIYLLLASTGNVITGTLADTVGWPAAYGLVTVLLVAVVASIGVNRLLGLRL